MTQYRSNDYQTVIKVLKEFYEEYQVHPNMRILIKRLEAYWDKDKANSTYLYKLFPENPIREASVLAGLPKPKKCL